MGTSVTRGGRVVELLCPFEHLGRPINEVRFKPVELDHLLRWQAGEFGSSMALMAVLADEEQGTLRALTFPDADRVLAEFMMHLPAAIRADIESGRIPIASPAEAPQPEARSVPFPEERGRWRPAGETAEQPPDYIPGVDGGEPGPGFDLSDGDE
jgi:hypothetical protein